MRELTPQAAVELAFDRGLCRFSDRPRATLLSGGVSSTVVLVETDDPARRWVLKQPCAKLKVAQDWQCSVERIWREVEVLEICGQLLARGYELSGRAGIRVPEIVFTDRDNYVYAMTAAPEGGKTWKELLLAGEFDVATAELCGVMLGQLHGNSWCNPEISQRLDDREYFEQLRILPYYVHVILDVLKDRSPLQEELAKVTVSVWENRWSLVHGDFSPKNLLVSPGQLMLIDFEVGHFGDPAFDLGFFLTHFVGKEIHYRRSGLAAARAPDAVSPLELANRFWTVYRETLRSCQLERDFYWDAAFGQLELRAMRNLGGCLLARVEGKSPLEYLQTDDRELMRALSVRILYSRLPRWPETYEQLLAACRRLS